MAFSLISALLTAMDLALLNHLNDRQHRSMKAKTSQYILHTLFEVVLCISVSSADKSRFLADGYDIFCQSVYRFGTDRPFPMTDLTDQAIVESASGTRPGN